MKFSPPKQHQRSEILQRQQRLKMARSAHAYVRGNTVKFYQWLETAKGKVPDGPPIWICGDCHVGNLGPVSDSDGNVEIEIRDLDQTVIGNPAHDLIRLALSLAMAARSSDLPGVTTALMMERIILGYTDALRTGKAVLPASEKGGAPIKMVLKEALARKWRHLATERIEDVRPTIPLGPKFWALSSAEREEIVIIQSFMPKAMDAGEVEAAAKAVIAELGAASMKDMGKVIATLKERYAGQMDFAKASGTVKALLSAPK